MEEKLIAYSTLSGNGCWEWQGGKSTVGGYGQVCVGKSKQRKAHRVSYETFIGEIPKGLVVMHSCDNRCCINPLHLSVGTYKDNAQDTLRKGRGITPSTIGEKNPRCKLTEKQVIEIKNSKESLKILSGAYGVSKTTISEIRNGKRWKHIE